MYGSSEVTLGFTIAGYIGAGVFFAASIVAGIFTGGVGFLTGAVILAALSAVVAGIGAAYKNITEDQAKTQYHYIDKMTAELGDNEKAKEKYSDLLRFVLTMLDYGSNNQLAFDRDTENLANNGVSLSANAVTSDMIDSKSSNFTIFSNHKKRITPHTTNAAKSCEGKPPLNIDS